MKYHNYCLGIIYAPPYYSKEVRRLSPDSIKNEL